MRSLVSCLFSCLFSCRPQPKLRATHSNQNNRHHRGAAKLRKRIVSRRSVIVMAGHKREARLRAYVALQNRTRWHDRRSLVSGGSG